MKKSFFSLVLAIAAGVWTLSNAMCLGSLPDAMYQPYTTVSGTIQELPLPCEPGEDCPPCLTEAIVTNDKTYYLTTKNQQVADFLEQIQTSPVPAIYLLPLKATASGTPYQMGSFDYLLISSLNELSVEYFSDQQENKLPSLCDEWNVWYESFESFGPITFDKVIKYQLTGDTTINGQQYVKLASDKESPYKGALREGTNRDIYFILARSTHEYLLYAFNAQVGDVFDNLYLGAFGEESGYSGIVESISNDSLRIFTLRVPYPEPEPGMESGATFSVRWIEGIGSPETPLGMAAVPSLTDAVDVGVYTLLCAYKNGEQVYVSKTGEEYGCEYNQTPLPTDTIPLYTFTGDDPGSSTVDPVDPNQVVATLKGDELTIKESSGETITYQLSNTSASSAPGFRKMSQSQTFQGEISVTLTEEGNYSLILTNPGWNYRIVGRFEYPKKHQGIDPVAGDEEKSGIKKVLRNGQIVIERNGKRYNLLGGEL